MNLKFLHLSPQTIDAVSYGTFFFFFNQVMQYIPASKAEWLIVATSPNYLVPKPLSWPIALLSQKPESKHYFTQSLF